MNAAHTWEPAAPERLAGIDLNLLVAFDALCREESVTRAAERVGVTQSAMSHALKRLRDLFGDPLFVRGNGGMRLTPRAEALVQPVRGGLTTLGRVLAEPDPFDPASTRRAFRLSSPDLFDILVIPSLLARIRNEAPGVDIGLVSRGGRRLAEQLESGELDTAIVPKMELEGRESDEMSAPGLIRRMLFRDRHVCLLRSDHPALGEAPERRGEGQALRSFPLRAYAALSHVLVSPTGEGQGIVDEMLAKHGLVRRVALRVPYFYSALAIVAKSDLILTAPSGLASLAPHGIAVVQAPRSLRLPRHSVNLVWHERFSMDPGHVWLRGRVADASRAVAFEG